MKFNTRDSRVGKLFLKSQVIRLQTWKNQIVSQIKTHEVQATKSVILALVLVVVLRGRAKADQIQPPVQPGQKEVSTQNGCTIEKFTVHCSVMKRDIPVIVILPPAYAADAQKRFPVLYTLHGGGASYSVFSDMWPLLGAIKTEPMLCVGFDGDKLGWFIDATKKQDSQFTTFFFKELIPYIEKNYRTDPQARAVTGFSMGGYGAFYYMVVHPEMFTSVSSQSGVFFLIPGSAPVKPDYGPVYATPETLKKEGLFDLLGPIDEDKAAYEHVDVGLGIKAAIAKHIKLPPMYVTCGTEDYVRSESRALRDFLTQAKLSFEYVERPGAHNFPLWRDSITDIIDFHWRTFQGKYKPFESKK